jgi:hypothetical protein
MLRKFLMRISFHWFVDSAEYFVSYETANNKLYNCNGKKQEVHGNVCGKDLWRVKQEHILSGKKRTYNEKAENRQESPQEQLFTVIKEGVEAVENCIG